MEDEEFKDYLADKAKEILNEQTSDVGKAPEKKEKLESRAEKESESKIPFAWDPREVEHLAKNRKSMTNKELENFMDKDSELHEKMEEIDEWTGFARWEERFLLQNVDKEIEDLAEEMDRSKPEIEAKKIMMGIQGTE
ncbi:hypothetical protein [Candidatus Nanohalococcus occultus]|uniref:Uncharacterized protein n=1 Tax=Candidatus Nanohalococcus occultus TaxID=2978047 RepID=A0ABY8CDX5_9ARCH|nr:hypothetical protein SVXNc_0368 [Candidatus Nanohaloarchaeota archaeon SVXNc]